jgi:lipopolysaccharide transport system permease protein
MSDAPTRTVIEPPRGFAPFDLGELLRHRELLLFLTWRDVTVRYKQTVLGALWAVLQPALTMVVFTVLFGTLARFPSEGAPYAVFSYAGLLPWVYFQNGVTHAGNSVVANARLVTKVYFPRIFLPMASTVAAVLDYAIALGLLAVLMVAYGIAPSAELLVLPLLLPLSFLAATGVGMGLGALNVRYRDVRYVTPFLLQIWMFLTPVIYPMSMVPERFRWLAALNPMSGIVEAHRAAVLPEKAVDWTALAVAAAGSAALFALGALYFKRVERTFADVI